MKVHPRARRERIAGAVGGVLRLEVTSAPERGAANAAVEDLLSAVLGVPRSAVSVVSGHTSRAKKVAVVGLAACEAATRLAGSA